MKRYKKIEFIIIFIIIINENFLRIIPINLSSIISIIGAFILIFKFKNILKKRYVFKKYIISLSIICFLSEIGSYFMYGQPIIYGIFGMNFIFIYFIYFYFVDLFDKLNNSEIEKIKKNIIYISSILSILYLIQAFIYPKIIIFNMSYAERGGEVRFFTGYVLIMFSIVISYSYLLEKFNKKILFNIIIQIISLIVVSQTRNFIIAIILVIIYGLIISKKVNKIILIYILFCVFIIYILLFSSKDNLINSVLCELKTRDGTIGTRFLEFKFYLDLLKENIFTGIGILYTGFELTPIITGYYPYLYFVGDLGLIGVVIQTGILGLVWMCSFFSKIYITSNKLKRNNLLSFYLLRLTLVLIIGAFASGLIFDKGSIVYICLILAISEKSLKNKKVIK